MNRNQWFALALSCMIMAILFVGVDTINTSCLNAKLSYVPYGELDISDVWCIVNAEIYEPFIYMFYALSLVFLLMGFLEPKKK